MRLATVVSQALGDSMASGPECAALLLPVPGLYRPVRRWSPRMPGRRTCRSATEGNRLVKNGQDRTHPA